MACRTEHEAVGSAYQLATGVMAGYVPTPGGVNGHVQNCPDCGCFMSRDGGCVNGSCNNGTFFNTITSSQGFLAAHLYNHYMQSGTTLSQAYDNLSPEEKESLLTDTPSPFAARVVHQLLGELLLQDVQRGNLSAINRYKEIMGEDMSKDERNQLAATMAMAVNDGKLDSRQMFDEIITWPAKPSHQGLIYAVSAHKDLSGIDWKKAEPILHEKIAQEYGHGPMSSRLLYSLMHNPTVPDEQVENLVPYVAASNPHFIYAYLIRDFLGRSPVQKEANLRLLANSSSHLIRKEVAKLLHTPADILRELARDSNAGVGRAALRNLIENQRDPSLSHAFEKTRQAGISEEEAIEVLLDNHRGWKSLPRCTHCGCWMKLSNPVCNNPRCSEKDQLVKHLNNNWPIDGSPLISSVDFTLYAYAKGGDSETRAADVERLYRKMEKAGSPPAELRPFIKIGIRKLSERSLDPGANRLFFPGGKVLFNKDREVFEVEYRGVVAPIPARTPAQAMKAVAALIADDEQIKVCPETYLLYEGDNSPWPGRRKFETPPSNNTPEIPKSWKEKEPLSVLAFNKDGRNIQKPIPGTRRFVNKDGTTLIIHTQQSPGYYSLHEDENWTMSGKELSARTRWAKIFIDHTSYVKRFAAISPDSPFIQGLKSTPTGIRPDTTRGLWVATDGYCLVVRRSEEEIPYDASIPTLPQSMIPRRNDNVIIGKDVLAWQDSDSGSVVEVGYPERYNYPSFQTIFNGPTDYHRNFAATQPIANIDAQVEFPKVRIWNEGGRVYAEGVNNSTPLQEIGRLFEQNENFDVCVNPTYYNKLLSQNDSGNTVVVSVDKDKFGPIFFAAEDASFVGVVMPMYKNKD